MNEQENNVRLIRSYNDAFNRGDIAALVQAFSDPTRNHDRVVPRAAVARVFEDIRTRFPDAQLSIDRIVAIGDQVPAPPA